MRISHSTDKLELIFGVALLITGWSLTLLMVAYVLPRDVVLSLISYAASLAGLMLTMYGLTLRLVKKRRGEAGE